jgi:hemerythrin-like metal-binding protein
MLVWREELSVGHPEIDGDHKVLIGIINDFENTVDRWDGDKVVHEVLIKLHDYAMQHFTAEEAIQVANHYPLREEHKREHRVLLAQVVDRANRFFIKKTEPVTKEALQGVAEFLKRWLVDHIIKSDLRMRRYVAKGGA